MNTRLTYWVFAIGSALFSYLVYGYGIGNIVHNLERTGWWFLPIVLVWAVVYCCNALAWFVILRDHQPEIRFAKIFRLSVSAFALNYMTPFLSLGGEPYRTAALEASVEKHRAVSSVILYNMIRWVAHFIFWLTAIAAAFVTITLSPAAAAVLALICVLMLLSISFFVARHKRGIFVAFFSWMAARPFCRRVVGMLEPHKAALLVIDDQIRQLYLHHRRTFYASIGYEYVSRIIASFEFFFILKALGFAPTFLEAVFINAATSFILNMLFFVPFELGTREGGLFLIMQGLAYTQGIGVFIGLVNRLRELVWILIGMLLMLKTDKRPPGESFVQLIEREQRI